MVCVMGSTEDPVPGARSTSGPRESILRGTSSPPSACTCSQTRGTQGEDWSSEWRSAASRDRRCTEGQTERQREGEMERETERQRKSDREREMESDGEREVMGSPAHVKMFCYICVFGF